MAFKYPQSPDEHDNDGLAIDALRAIFPKSWKYKSSADIYGHKEYGDDLIIELRDKNKNVTGIEFCVQNKVNPKVNKNSVAVKGMKLTTLWRLVSMPKPALLHAYVEKSNKSYYLWLHEWFFANYKAEWKKQETITINIPKSNILDKQAVDKILSKLNWDHLVQKTKTIADFISKNQTDYEIRVLSHANNLSIITDPQNTAAIPQVVFSDEDIYKSALKVIETGEPVVIPKSMLSKDSFRIYFSQDLSLLDNVIDTEFEQLIFFPVPQDITMPLKIEYFDENGEVLYQTPFVMMNLIEPGSVRRKWQGKPDNEPVIYTLTEDGNQNTTEFQVRLLSAANRKADVFLKRLAIVNPQNPVRKYSVTDIQTGISHNFDTLGFPSPRDAEQHNILMRFFEMIVEIETRIGIEIPVTRITDIDYKNAQIILAGLTQGWIKVDIEKSIPQELLPNYCLIGQDTILAAQKLLEGFDEHQKIYLYITRSYDLEIELCGQKIQLGKVRYEFPNTKILNPEALRENLSQESKSEQKIINIPFIIDRDEARVKLMAWQSDDNTEIEAAK